MGSQEAATTAVSFDRNSADIGLHQYWYSERTIQALLDEMESCGASRLAILSAPSLFFAMPPSLQEKSTLFEYDNQWAEHPGFVHYDFNCPDGIPASCQGAFDFALVDPPALCDGPLQLYKQACDKLLGLEGRPPRIILCSTKWNHELAKRIFDAQRTPFAPCLPGCDHWDDFAFFANYETSKLQRENVEVAEHPCS
eukprot:TRINITY_DN42267_c0_g1_i1.p1 TRINITY_DN42267_c0_g1~~TRINITY_DN42267_c0_g1_i1.p1  ORF type:complete len:231 (+),score=37.42 TRINITY_DN42267_c0_g1_i1:105-695(+)